MIQIRCRGLCRLVLAQLMLVGLGFSLSAYAVKPVTFHFKESLTLSEVEVIDNNAQANGRGVVRCKVQLKDGTDPVPWGYVRWVVDDKGDSRKSGGGGADYCETQSVY